MSEREILERIIPYIPPYWVRQAFADPDRTLVGREERIYATVLFVDISGFTPISEALSKKGRQGVEELFFILERYFTVMSEPVMALGGEVVKFAGDSLIVLFPAQPDGGDAHLGAALHCSLRMQNAMSEFARVRTSAGMFPLRMKIGIGEGAIYNTTVGDEENGMQPVFAGRPIARCVQAEDMANPGEIVADAALVNRMPGRLDVGEARGTFRLIAGATDVPVLPPIQQVDLSELDPESAALLIHRMASYLPDQLVERIRQGRRGVYGEHKRVTIMFVKFGGVNFDLDPSVGHVLQIYFTTMRDCILRHGGRLNEVDIVSDGGTLVVFFGAPSAHEDHQLRAVSCAWEMQQAVADVRIAAGDAAKSLRQCMGISSDAVYVGDVGAPVRRTYAAVGDEVNLASRLMNLAHWGEVVATSGVRKRAAGRFEFEAMGEANVKGKAEPVPIFALVAPRQESIADNLLSRLMDRRLLVGRAAELAALRDVQEQAWQGKPQLLLISGEAGLGKSRLVGELAQEWVGQGGRVYVGDCRHQGSDVPYGPWITLLRAALGMQETDSMDRQREKIETQLTFLSPSLERRSELFGDLLQVDIPRNPFSPIPSPDEQTSRKLQVLKDFFQILAQRQPLLLVIENLQDVDDASLAFLNDLLDDLRGLPFLICAAYRSAEIHLAEHQVPTTHLVLAELSEEDSLTLAQRLLEDVGLSADLAPAVVGQTQGNPLYLQETVLALANFSSADLDPATALARGMIIPESISDMVQAQLDYLDEDYKLTLRIAAVIGQYFGFRVLQAAHPLPISQHDLTVRLATLERMHVICMERFGTEIQYRFRHLMTQRVIYASLLSADRERFHRRVGQALEMVYVNDLDTRSELLADHFHRGNVLPKAVNYLLLAGQRAAQTRADCEALAHYSRAEEVLSACDTCHPRCVQGVQLTLQFRRGDLHYRLIEVPEAIGEYECAVALAGRLVDLKSQGEALLWLGNIALCQARYQEANDVIRRAMQPFSALEDGSAMVRALLSVSKIHALQGHFQNATRYAERAASFEEALQDDVVTARCKIWQGEIYFRTGRLSQASDALDWAIDLGRRMEEQAIVVEGTSRLAQVLLYRGRWGQAIQLSRQSVEISGELGNRLIVADAQRVLALVLTRVGVYEEAYRLLSDVLSAFADAGWRAGLASAFGIAGEVLLALGRYEEANERLQQSLRLGRESHTVEAVVNAQLGLSKLAAVSRNWPEEQRLCTEVRAKARQANLEFVAVSARLGLARAYLGRREWKRARHEASQALDASHRLRCPYEIFCAAATLGEALLGLDQFDRAQQYFQEAHDIIQRLADTLPRSYVQIFLNRPYIRVVREYAAGQPVDIF